MPSTVSAISLPRLPGAESLGFERGYGSVLLRLPCLVAVLVFWPHFCPPPAGGVRFVSQNPMGLFFVFVVFFFKNCAVHLHNFYALLVGKMRPMLESEFCLN